MAQPLCAPMLLLMATASRALLSQILQQTTSTTSPMPKFPSLPEASCTIGNRSVGYVFDSPAEGDTCYLTVCYLVKEIMHLSAVCKSILCHFYTEY